jgi:butyrate response factor
VFLQSAAALEASTMQEALVSPANAGRLRFRSALELKPFAFGDQRLASPRYLNLNLNLGGADDALFRCSSPTFSPSFGFSSSPSPLATSSVSLSPTSSASLADDGCDGAGTDADADAATGHTLRLARLALQYQEVADRYELCLARLADAADDAAALRRENAELRNANADLTRRLALLSGIGKQVAAAAAEEARRLRFGEPKTVPAAKDCATEKPAVLPPKSISVRSIDFLLEMNQPKQVQPPATTPAARNRKHRASNPTKPSSVSPVHASPILTSHLLIGLASDIVAYAP